MLKRRDTQMARGTTNAAKAAKRRANGNKK